MIEVRQTATFAAWFQSLRDRRARARIEVRIDRLALWNPGDVKPIGHGVGTSDRLRPRISHLLHQTRRGPDRSLGGRRQAYAESRHRPSGRAGAGGLENGTRNSPVGRRRSAQDQRGRRSLPRRGTRGWGPRAVEGCARRRPGQADPGLLEQFAADQHPPNLAGTGADFIKLGVT